MSLSFAGLPTTNWKGVTQGQPAFLCPPNGRTSQVSINWLDYGLGTANPSAGINVDLSGIAPAVALDAVRSIYIDNLGQANAVYVYFPDTGYTIVGLPFSATWAPVVTSNKKATIYGIGLTDTTLGSVQVYFNSFQMPFSSYAVPQDLTVNPVDIEFTGAVQSVIPGTAFNLVVPLGPAIANRNVIIAVFYWSSQTGNTPVVGAATFNGANMPLFSNVASNSPANVSLAVVEDATSVNATIGLGFGLAQQRCLVAAWSMTGNDSPTPFDSVITQFQSTVSAANAANTQLKLPRRGALVSLNAGYLLGTPAASFAQTGSSYLNIINDANPAVVASYTTNTFASGFSGAAFGHIGSNTSIDPFSILAAWNGAVTAPFNNGCKSLSVSWQPG